MLSLKPTDLNDESESESASCSAMSDSLQPHRLQPARLLCPSDSPGKNTGVVGISFSRESYQPRSLTFQADSLPSEPPGKV